MMECRAEVRLSARGAGWLCFRHAVLRAMNGETIEVDIGDFSNEYCLGTHYCVDCAEILRRNP